MTQNKKSYNTPEGRKIFWESPKGIELKHKFSLERTGKKRSPVTIEKMRNANLGKKYSDEVNKKKGRKGRTGPNKGRKFGKCWNKGLPKELQPMFGKTHSEKTRKLYSSLFTGKKLILSEQQLKERSQNHMGKRNGMFGKNYSLEARRMMSESVNQRKFPFKNTKPERMMQIALSLNGIKFEKHKMVPNGKGFWHSVDIFIEPNICLEVDGRYFHTQPKNAKRDIIVNHELTISGYTVIRIWDTDIKNNTQGCAENVIKIIKDRQEISKQ